MVTRSPLADKGLARSIYRGLMCVQRCIRRPPNPARGRTLKQIKGAAPNHVLSPGPFFSILSHLTFFLLTDTVSQLVLLLQNFAKSHRSRCLGLLKWNMVRHAESATADRSWLLTY
ncbi:hypothetical protein F4819DRAFT_460324 [Hypoxylon fuscum]|nr:hypothetical protein F4819DRAFT_460324 [Hypoxylon fuscum]